MLVGGIAAGAPSAGGEALPPSPATVAAVDLPAGLQPAGINDQGRIVAKTAESDTGSDPQQVVVVERGAVTATVGPWEPYLHPLCSPEQCFFPAPAIPFVNDSGVVATVIGGHAVLWDHGAITDLDGDAAGSWLFGLDDRGAALVVRFMDDHQVLGVWHRGAFTPIRTLPLAAVVVRARASERGHVVASVVSLESLPPTTTSFVWFRGVTTDLGGLEPADVNRNGQVAGLVRGATPVDTLAVVWQDGELTQLQGLGGRRSGAVAINDRGQVAGFSTYPDGATVTSVLWDHGRAVDIGAAAGAPNQPRVIDQHGRVLVSGASPVFGFFGAVWDRRRLRLLPPSNEPDVSVEPFTMNDRGQVVGRRAPSSGPAVPMLWEL
jgi:uncharacterized membrane protein